MPESFVLVSDFLSKEAMHTADTMDRALWCVPTDKCGGVLGNTWPGDAISSYSYIYNCHLLNSSGNILQTPCMPMHVNTMVVV